MSTFTWIGGLPGPYNMNSAPNWTPTGVPGAADVALLQNAGSTGPYTLNGSLTLGELLVIGDIAILKGSIAASGSLSDDMAINGGGQFTVASTGAFTGGDIIVVGTNLSAGQLTVDGLLNTGQVDVFNQGTLAVGSTGTLNGDIFMAGGTLTVTPGVTLTNSIHLDGGTAATIDTSGVLTLNGVIDEVAGHGSLVINGGTVVLDGTNTFSGGVTLASGVLSVGSAGLGSATLSVIDGMLLATNSETLSGNVIQLGPISTLAAAHGQTLVITNQPTSGFNDLSGAIFFGAPGANGAVQLNLGATFYGGGPRFIIQAGTLLETSTGSSLIGGYPLSIAAGGTFDLIGRSDLSGTLTGSGVLTNSGTASQFQVNGGSFAGTIDGAVELFAQSSPTLAGTIAASAEGSIYSGSTLNLVTGALIASAIQDGGLLQSVGTDMVSGAISGAGSIIVNGGSLTLNGSNSFTGGVTVLAGTLSAGPLAIGNPGSSALTMNGGMLFAASSETITNNIELFGTVTLAAAHGQSLVIDNLGSSYAGNNLNAVMNFGAPGADGVVVLDLGPTGFGLSTEFDVQAGRLIDSSFGLIGGHALSITAGATFDLNSQLDQSDTLTGNGVLTNSGTTSRFAIFGGNFAGTIEGPVQALFESTSELIGTLAAATPGTIDTTATLDLGPHGLIASALIDNGLLDAIPVFGVGTIAASITGSGTLLQASPMGALVVTGLVDVTGSTTLSAGTLDIGNGGTTGALVGNITDNAEMVFDHSDNVDFAGTIGGGGVVVQQGSGTLTLSGTNNISGGIFINTGVIELANSAAAGSATVIFNAPSTLRLDSISFANTIDSFGGGKTIDLAALPFNGPTFSYNGTILDVISSGTTVALSLPGTFTQSMFGAFNDGHGGTAIIACFAAGTRIATPRGGVAVEQLREGDEVITVSGRREPIRWIGRRRLDCRRHPNPERVWPVRIAPHAFGEGRPKRALMLSPDHSVYTEGVLIPIRFLINDATITQIKLDRIAYYHIELDRHDVVLAEGLPAETYLETGGRSAFENSGVTDLYPDFAPDDAVVGEIWSTQAYAPMLGADGEFERTRRMLATQAIMLAMQQPRRKSRA